MPNSNVQNMDFFEKVGYVFSLWGESWNAFKLNVWTFVGLYIMPMIAVVLLVGVYLTPFLAVVTDNSALAVSSIILAVVVTLLVVCLFILIMPALTLAQIESAKGNKITISSAINQGLPYVVQYLLASILCTLAIVSPLLLSFLLLFVVIGLLLLPIALLWALVATFFLFLVPYLVINDNLSALDAIKKSIALTRQKWHWVSALLIVSAIISVASSLPLVGYIAGPVLGIVYLCLPAIIYINQIAKNDIANQEKANRSKSKPVVKALKSKSAKKTKK